MRILDPRRRAALVWPAAALLGWACSNDPPPPRGAAGDLAGQPCTVPANCYPGVEAGALKGEVRCLSVTGGYCTHVCLADTDCCAIPGECRTNLPEVCSPFESQPDKMCFLTCEDADLQQARTELGWQGTDANAFCQFFANASFTCRSSGGGTDNRKICM